MKNFKKWTGGFTLIELLVVVAIIGILASVVLGYLGTSKNKSEEAAVKANLNTVRNQAELFYSNNGNSFLPAGGLLYIASCPVYDASGTNMFSRDKTISNAIAEAKIRGSGIAYCYNSSLLWAVAVGLKSNTNTSWCIDSAGNSKQVNSAPSSAINNITFSCN